MRMLTAEARIDAHRFRSGFLNEKDYGRLSHALGTLAEARVFIDDSASLGVAALAEQWGAQVVGHRRTPDDLEQLGARHREVRAEPLLARPTRLRQLGVEQLDLFILHQALPGEFDLTLDAYRALEKLLPQLAAVGGVVLGSHARALEDDARA